MSKTKDSLKSQKIEAIPKQAGSPLPQVKEHVGLLLQDGLDAAGLYCRVVHLVPLPIAGLSGMSRSARWHVSAHVLVEHRLQVMDAVKIMQLPANLPLDFNATPPPPPLLSKVPHSVSDSQFLSCL